MQQTGDELSVTADGLQWRLPLRGERAAGERVVKNRERLRGKLTLGIRPEDLLLVPTGGENGAAIPCRVTLVEHMGASNLLIVQAGKQQLTVATPADFYLPPGSHAALVVNPAKVHFFEASSGRNVTL